MYLNISNIQHFSVGDGPGIRTTVFVKGCNLHCPWCHNPETISSKQQILHYEDLDKTVTSGRRMKIEEIVDDVLCDFDFYEESGGGVTLSGGEVMLQAECASILAKELQTKGISVWIDTAGNVSYESFQRMNPYVDGYLFDYKTPKDEKYRKIVGGELELISDNLRRIIENGKNVRVRIPLIPGFNIHDDDINMMCQNLRDIGATKVDLLPFHRMGSGKYRALGMKYQYEQTEPISKERLEQIKQQFSKYFETTLEE